MHHRVWHKHSEVEVNFVERGQIDYRIGNSLLRIKAGETAAFWGIAPHRLVAFAPGTRYYWLSLPLPMLLQWDLPVELAAALLRGESLNGCATPCTGLPEYFEMWQSDISKGSREREKLVQREIQNWISRLWFGMARPTSEDRSPPGGDILGHVGCMARFAAEYYRNPISVQDIAQAAGIHPNYAMNLFRKTCCMSIVEYVTRLRVGHAQQLLQNTDRKVLDIAFESGFRTPSRFYSAFKRISGQSPSDTRTAYLPRG